jgi:hypothetical protein
MAQTIHGRSEVEAEEYPGYLLHQKPKKISRKPAKLFRKINV